MLFNHLIRIDFGGPVKIRSETISDTFKESGLEQNFRLKPKSYFEDFLEVRGLTAATSDESETI